MVVADHPLPGEVVIAGKEEGERVETRCRQYSDIRHWRIVSSTDHLPCVPKESGWRNEEDKCFSPRVDGTGMQRGRYYATSAGA